MERDRLQYPGDDSRSGGSAIKDISDDKLKMQRCKAELWLKVPKMLPLSHFT